MAVLLIIRHLAIGLTHHALCVGSLEGSLQAPYAP
jgi:hypothetical protein